MLAFPKLSIAAKLYAIFALMATITVSLSVVAVQSARHHAALTDEFESSNSGTLNVERVNALIYAVVMDRAASICRPTSRHRSLMPKASANSTVKSPKSSGSGSVRFAVTTPNCSAQFSKRIAKFIEFRDELARLGTEVSPTAGREWGDNEANRSVRKALNRRSRKAHRPLFSPRVALLRRHRRRHRPDGLATERSCRRCCPSATLAS